jgi:hypothetical protein
MRPVRRHNDNGGQHGADAGGPPEGEEESQEKAVKFITAGFTKPAAFSLSRREYSKCRAETAQKDDWGAASQRKAVDLVKSPPKVEAPAPPQKGRSKCRHKLTVCSMVRPRRRRKVAEVMRENRRTQGKRRRAKPFQKSAEYGIDNLLFYGQGDIMIV